MENREAGFDCNCPNMKLVMDEIERALHKGSDPGLVIDNYGGVTNVDDIRTKLPIPVVDRDSAWEFASGFGGLICRHGIFLGNLSTIACMHTFTYISFVYTTYCCREHISVPFTKIADAIPYVEIGCIDTDKMRDEYINKLAGNKDVSEIIRAISGSWIPTFIDEHKRNRRMLPNADRVEIGVVFDVYSKTVGEYDVQARLLPNVKAPVSLPYDDYLPYDKSRGKTASLFKDSHGRPIGNWCPVSELSRTRSKKLLSNNMMFSGQRMAAMNLGDSPEFMLSEFLGDSNTKDKYWYMSLRYNTIIRSGGVYHMWAPEWIDIAGLSAMHYMESIDRNTFRLRSDFRPFDAKFRMAYCDELYKNGYTERWGKNLYEYLPDNSFITINRGKHYAYNVNILSDYFPDIIEYYESLGLPIDDKYWYTIPDIDGEIIVGTDLIHYEPEYFSSKIGKLI